MTSTPIVFFTAREASEIRKWIEITLPLRKKNDYANTVYDLRLGAFESGQVCETCGEKDLGCPGHFGYIDLTEPCFNPVYAEAIILILHSICLECKSPRIDLSPSEFCSPFKYVEKAKAVNECGVCKAELPKFFFRKVTDKAKDGANTSASITSPAVMKFSQKQRKDAEELSAKDVLMIFEKITDETFKIIGFNAHAAFLVDQVRPLGGLDASHKLSLYHLRPEALLTEVLPVLPSTARPRVLVGSESRSDDLTEAYNKIVKLVCKARGIDRISDAKEKEYLDINKRIQNEFWKMTAVTPKNGKTSGVRTIKSLADRQGGKDGRKTSNVAGKRSDMTSRTVGSPGGTEIPFGSLGYPRIFAAKLSIAEPITYWNLKWANALLGAGKVNLVVRNGLKIVASKVVEKMGLFIYGGREGLVVGDKIHRQLMDGDPGQVNRQPSLRIESIQGIELKLVDEITQKFPLACVRPLGADFDGKSVMADDSSR